MTRACIILNDGDNFPQLFYAHCDGYPLGILPILVGHELNMVETCLNKNFKEITTIPGDVDYVYEIHLNENKILTYDNRFYPHVHGLLRTDSITENNLEIIK